MPPPLLAFGFAHLPLLGWLAAAAAPLVIHLLSRRKYRETTWAAMEYLLAAVKRQTRTIRIEQWLLLLIRTLLVVLLVLAVAEPIVERAGAVIHASGRTHRVLVFDASYSMDAKPSDRTRFEQAKELASRIVDQSVSGDAFTLVLMAAPPRVVVGTPAFEASQVHQEIASLELLHTGADLPATIAEVQKLIEKVRRDNPRLERHEVYFLTDMQRSTWSPELSAAARAEFRRRSEDLSRAAGLTVLDLGRPGVENLAVTELHASDAVVTAGRSVELEAEVKDFSHRAWPRQAVELFVDGRQAARQTADVPAGGVATVRFTHRFEIAGDYAVEVRTSGDGLDADNHRYLAIPVRQAIRALCIDGRPAGEPFRGSADYLAAALAPHGDAQQRALIDVDTASESALLEGELAVYDCTFLANVAQFTASEARVLDAYLAHGGNLVFFLGSQVMAARYNEELGPAAGKRRLLPATLGAIVDNAEKAASIDPLGYRHPIVQAFRGRDKAGLLTMPVAKYFKLEVPNNTGARVVLALSNGDPLVIEEPIRHGHVVLVGTSADRSWTQMPVWPSYVPVVQEIAAWSVGGQSQQRNASVGETLEGSVPAAAGEAPVSIERPDGQTKAVLLHSEGDYSVWSYDDTYRSGGYTARIASGTPSVQRFAVNVNTAESDLAALSGEELQSEVWPGITVSFQTTWQGDHSRTPAAILRPERLHVELLYLVLGLLFVESVLAWRFGHHIA